MKVSLYVWKRGNITICFLLCVPIKIKEIVEFYILKKKKIKLLFDYYY